MAISDDCSLMAVMTAAGFAVEAVLGAGVADFPHGLADYLGIST